MVSALIIGIVIALVVVGGAGALYFTELYSDPIDEVVCTQEAKLCPDGSYVSRNPDLNCEFNPCPDSDGGDVYCTDDVKVCPDGSYVVRDRQNACAFKPCPEVNGTRVYCTPESRNVEACTFDYNPVCGWNDPEKIQCIRYPCAQTYGNGCQACSNENVEYYTVGECPSGMEQSNLNR